ncbi:MAG: M67 family metallopeptidase [Actinobacteria bacterium]|nr:M67 family metallopeptidase [Actinomycetota bacterium]MCL6105490.1 M67 family metallopeptidase [Actinomycetota bacterium]
MLKLTKQLYDDIVTNCIAGLPQEACGLIGGYPSLEKVVKCYPARNIAQSARLYEVHPLDYLKADRDAQENKMEIIGVYHSHTLSEAYPSETDLRQAPDPDWHYILVSLKDEIPVLRSYRIQQNIITEEPLIFD